MFTKAVLLFLLLAKCDVQAATTKVGNGDDGSDLEGATPIHSGPIVDSRDLALARVRRLNVEGIAGLGLLVPEIEKSKLFLSKMDSRIKLGGEEESRFHSNLSGYVYARTFAEHHASTRFFPISKKLDTEQLIALHVHEALHRALPNTVNQDEAVVSELTLAITGPDATHDLVRATAERLIPALPARFTPSVSVSSTAAPGIAQEASYPSNVGYEYRQFLKGDMQTRYPVDRMHVLYSHLYPLTTGQIPIGMGLGLSVIESNGNYHMGPLNLSARVRLWSPGSFDIGAFLQAQLNTLSDGELKNSPYGRDIITAGLSLSRETVRMYIENSLSISQAGENEVTIGKLPYLYEYGKVLQAKIKTGFKMGNFRIGGFAQVHLADYFKVSGGSFALNTGRYRLFSTGPEFSFVSRDYSVSIFGQILLDGSKDANFDYLGNLVGPGVSQGSIGVSVSSFF